MVITTKNVNCLLKGSQFNFNYGKFIISRIMHSAKKAFNVFLICCLICGSIVTLNNTVLINCCKKAV